MDREALDEWAKRNGGSFIDGGLSHIVRWKFTNEVEGHQMVVTRFTDGQLAFHVEGPKPDQETFVVTHDLRLMHQSAQAQIGVESVLRVGIMDSSFEYFVWASNDALKAIEAT